MGRFGGPFAFPGGSHASLYPTMSDESESVLVKLTRMEGKLDLSNLRHDQHEQRVKTIDDRLHTHGNRIGVLEAARHLNEGERKGVALSTKVAVAIATLLAGGVGAALARLVA